MWEKSKVIVEKINKADCLTNKQLFQVEKLIQLFEAIETIAVLKGKKIEREKIQIPDCESDILKTIEKEACLNEDEFEVVRISLFIDGMWSSILDDLIDKMYAQNIINVDELTRVEAIERGFDIKD